MSKMKFEVQGNTSKFEANIQAGNHSLVIDEPKSLGGTDKGIDPLSNLLASLVGCENAIANFVAKEIKFDLQGIDFKVDGELDSRGLMGDSRVRTYFETINIQAFVKTSESEERVQELKEKTDARCPVFNTLKAADITINSEWKKA